MTRLAIDVGARFVDMIAWGTDSVRTCKQPVGDSFGGAVRAGLTKLHLPPAEVSEVRIASTGFLNHLHDALTTQTGPRIGLVTTAGFEDVAILGRQDRIGLYDPVARVAIPEHLIDPASVHGISARMDARGTELEPIDETRVDEIAEALSARGISAVAVCLLHAHQNGAHERAVASALLARLPKLPLSLSHVIDPQPREFERTVSTIVDSWLRLAVLPELAKLKRELTAEGFAGRWAWGDGRGVLRDAPGSLVSLLTGGPAASFRGAAAVIGTTSGDAIAVDIGSKTSDVALVRNGAPALTDSGIIAGLAMRGARVDMESLPVGGSQMVPGQTRFTLDEALIAAGLLDGETMCCADEAHHLLTRVHQHLAEAITRHATRRNVDPTRARLEVTGGAGLFLATGLADALGLTHVVMPRLPALAGAVGLGRAPRREEVRQRIDASLSDVTPAVLDEFARTGADTLGASPDGSSMDLFARISPRPRMPHMDIAFDGRSGVSLADAYHARYRKRYGIPPQGPGYVTLLCARCDDMTGALEADVAMVDAWMPHVPAGWRAAEVPGGYRLDRTRP